MQSEDEEISVLSHSEMEKRLESVSARDSYVAPRLAPDIEFAGWGKVHYIQEGDLFSIESGIGMNINSPSVASPLSSVDEDRVVPSYLVRPTVSNRLQGWAARQGRLWMPKRFHAKAGIAVPDEQLAKERHEAHLLGQFKATSIAGNDISSSCLYVAGLCTASGGKMAPLSLLLVVVVLFMFRAIYSEVGSALPLNGGSYTALLNTTSKLIGSVAACLTLVSYVATAVVSANESMEYAKAGVEGLFEWPVFWTTFGVLGIFAVLNLIGLSESANVALLIFIIHLGTLSLLLGVGIVQIIRFPEYRHTFVHNWTQQGPLHTYGTGEWYWTAVNYSADFFFGYAAALLGVTGFETSANYIEEQAPGVFPKTLRNMWIIVGFFNPVMGFLSQFILPIPEIIENRTNVLAHMGAKMGGDWLGIVVSADAVLVLCGSVLTSYVGVIGLVRRMALDRCLPQVIKAENPLTKTNYIIIIGFFLVTSSLYAVLSHRTNTLAGVYSISFLCVMSLFAIGCMLLKYKRSKIPRTTKAPWVYCIVGLLFVLLGLVGTVAHDPLTMFMFFIYFGVTFVIVVCMLWRVRLLRLVHYFVRRQRILRRPAMLIERMIGSVQSQGILFFTKNGDLSVLNRGILYIRDNELTDEVTVVHCSCSMEDIPDRLLSNVAMLDECYPRVKINVVIVQMEFSSQVVNRLSEVLHIPANFMFITCPGDEFPEQIGAYGGVRVITH